MILFLFLFKKFIDLILLENLEDYFENTPKEILDNDWKEIEYLNEIGPSIINIINQYTTPTEQRPQECKHLGDWWSCERTKEIVNGEEWTQTCDFYPNCSDCPDFTPKTEKQ